MRYFGGMFGIMQYVLPIGIFVLAIKLACDGREELTSKLLQYVIAIVSLSVVFSVFQISSGELQSSKDISELVKDAYHLGSQSKGGGAIGATAALRTTGEPKAGAAAVALSWAPQGQIPDIFCTFAA